MKEINMKNLPKDVIYKDVVIIGELKMFYNKKFSSLEC